MGKCFSRAPEGRFKKEPLLCGKLAKNNDEIEQLPYESTNFVFETAW